MKRLFVLLAALAATSAIVAGSAYAAGGTTVASCNAQNGYIQAGTSSNLDIPAGTFCYLSGEFKGNVTVEGYAAPNGATFDKNVNVTGGWIYALGSGAEFMGNLNITGSNYGMSGVNALRADYAPITIHGNLNYTGNSVPLQVAGPKPVKVNGTFTYSGNPVPWDASQPLDSGQSNIS